MPTKAANMPNSVKQERFAQILVPLNFNPAPVFGELVLGQNKYAVSYEDSNRKIPEWARLKLSPHNSMDMYGTPCTSYMVILKASARGPQEELDNLAKQHEKDGLMIEAVHDVYRVSEQSSMNGKGRIIRTITPNQTIHYSCNDPIVDLQTYQNAFRQTVMGQLLRTESNGTTGHNTLYNFKHIVQLVRVEKNSAYRYTLPADLPNEFLDRIREVGLDIQFGAAKKRVVFKISSHEPRVLPFRPRSIKDPLDTGINSVYKRFAIHAEQGYLEQSLQTGAAQLIHFNQPSTTCEEKIKLLNGNRDGSKGVAQTWSLDRVVAAHYFDSPGGYILLVGPRLGDLAKLIKPEQFLMNVTDRSVENSTLLPNGMEKGTCTPFVYASIGKKETDLMVILEPPRQFMDLPADYSIGGHGPSAHRASIQMTPQTAKQILTSEFGEKVRSMQHPLYNSVYS